MKTTIELADALAQEAREVARERGETLRALVESGLRREIDVHRGQIAAAGPFVLRTAGGDGLRPGIDPSRLIEYAYEEPNLHITP